jgi:elongation factor Ts
MSTISAQQVNELRKQTGAGMMDCKKALTEAEGDFEKAIEVLRKKGQKISASRSDRDATEGGIFAVISADGTKGVLVELNCETDFVARNEDFQKLGKQCADLALASQAPDVPTLLAQPVEGAANLGALLTEKMGVIGEKLDIRRVAHISGGRVGSYIHLGGRVGVLAAFDGIDGVEQFDVVAKDVCMQVTSMNPLALDKDQVDPSVIEKEIEIGKELARQEGKPEDMLEKIAQGKLQKFYKERTLLQQEFVKDPSVSVAQYVKKFGANLKVTGFVRISLGQ